MTLVDIVRASARRVEPSRRGLMFTALCQAAGIDAETVAYQSAKAQELERYRGWRQAMHQTHGMDASLQ